MKILYFTDTHYRGTNPQNRLDNFLETQVKKTEEVMEIARMEDVDYILHGGDLFDRPDIAISVVSTFAKIFKEAPAPIYIVSGNHDIYGHNPDTLNRTVMGLLCDLKVLNLVNGKDIYLKKDVVVKLTGTPYKYGMDLKENMKRYLVKEEEKDYDYRIHMTHGFIIDKSFVNTVDYTTVEDLYTTDADITLCGHYHLGFKTVCHDENGHKKYFINPGAMVRLSNSMLEIKRKPKVVIIELTNEIKLKEIYLKSALDGELVLDRSVMENFKSKRSRDLAFSDMVSSNLNLNKLNIFDMISEIAKENNLPEKVREEAIKRIGEAELESKWNI